MKNRSKQRTFHLKGNHRLKLSLLFTVTVGLLIWLTTIIVFAITRALRDSPLFQVGHVPPHTFMYVYAFMCCVIGVTLAFLCSHTVFRPLLKLMDAFDEISRGNYAVRVSTTGIFRIMKIGERFNKMAEELASVEMLQREFIDNFSHEFKTPLSSMGGFASLLKQDDLTPEQRHEYADIIISESKRLSTLSTTVLMLSKVEKQAMLTNVSRVNVAEQIRRVIALLDAKWAEKNIEVELYAQDVFLEGNASLLDEVWINLMDNAIKFSYSGEIVRVDVTQTDSHTSIVFSNTGEQMSEDTKKRIFDKFYQQDLSHTTQGYGLGMPIVKNIVNLHNGDIQITSNDLFSTVIEILLPNEQECE